MHRVARVPAVLFCNFISPTTLSFARSFSLSLSRFAIAPMNESDEFMVAG